METKNKARYETPSAEVLFVTMEGNILSVRMNGTTLGDDTYEEYDA